MKTLPNYLIALAAVGIAIGLAVRLVPGASGAMRPAFLDPVFFWRGAVAADVCSGYPLDPDSEQVVHQELTTNDNE